MGMRLLLISNSTQHGGGYLDHCEEELRGFLGSVRRVTFVPFALPGEDGYARQAGARLERMGYRFDSLHLAVDPVLAVAGAEAIFVGGGNTFRLLTRLYELRLLDPIRRAVDDGVPYVGSSAGSNVAGPSIKTTNDMPIVQPPSFDALGLVPFNLNPHYLDPDPASTHQGETREERIRQFHEMNDADVLALREGAMVRVEPPRVELRGSSGARIFRRGREPEEQAPGARMDGLLQKGG